MPAEFITPSSSSSSSSASGGTHLHDLPDPILSIIFSLVTDTRSRNSMSLVCRKWAVAERSSRTSLSLRANVRDLFYMPSSFRYVTHLDLSLCSPWGHTLLPPPSTFDPHMYPYILPHRFPNLSSLTLYSRHPDALGILICCLPGLDSVHLVRFHQRPPLPQGADLVPLFEHCPSLSSLDLSSFYCWTEDVPSALLDHPAAGSALTHLNLLILSPEGFKSQELQDVSCACPNLVSLLVSCLFDPRYADFVGDDTLLAVASNCPKLRCLHLVDASALVSPRSDPESEDFSHEDARISGRALEEVFAGLQELEDLMLDVCHNVPSAGGVLEVLGAKCRRLRSLKLGQFLGICRGDGPRPDGLATCGRLESLCIKSSIDLTDAGLIAIAIGCPRLSKLELHGCPGVSETGVKRAVCHLRRTLVDATISCCKQLDAASSLRALEPVRDRLHRLHVDCVWGSPESATDGAATGKKDARDFDLNLCLETVERRPYVNGGVDGSAPRKKGKYAFDGECSNAAGDGFWCKTWPRLRRLSLWIAVGNLLTPLPAAGLECCPALEEVSIKVEGDCRQCAKPAVPAFGLSSLTRYGQLAKMNLDCGDVIGYALSAPLGQLDLSLWERFYLTGIGELRLEELDYWPPQDRDMNSRSLWLPGTGLLSECTTLRKLFIHGTANEHFMRMLLRIPNLRDVQLREDYYPAPDDDMSEMRADSCRRFEDELKQRVVAD